MPIIKNKELTIKMTSLETIIKMVVLPADPLQREQGNKQLSKALKERDIIPSLCQLMESAQDMKCRQHCARLLKRKAMKNWNEFTPDILKRVQHEVLHALVSEPEVDVKESISHLMGVISSHMENIDQEWPELKKFLAENLLSKIYKKKKLGTSVLIGIASISIRPFTSSILELSKVFQSLLVRHSTLLSTIVVYNTIMCMKLFVPALKEHEDCIHIYNKLVPLVMDASLDMALKSDKKATEELELLEEMVRVKNGVFGRNIKAILLTCLNLSSKTFLGPLVRNKAIELTGLIAQNDTEMFLRRKLLKPTILVMFQLASLPENDEKKKSLVPTTTEEVVETTTEVVVENIRSLASCMPSDKIMHLVVQHVELFMRDIDDIYEKRCALLMLRAGITSVKPFNHSNCMDFYTDCIIKGISDPSPVVWMSAFETLKIMAIVLQPDINKSAPRLLPVLITFLEETHANISSINEEHIDAVGEMFFQLKCFLENSMDAFLPLLPILVEVIVVLGASKNSTQLRHCSCSAISAAVKFRENLIPYLPAIFCILKECIIELGTTDDSKLLQVHATETLDGVAKELGEHFMPYARESVELGVSMAQKKIYEVSWCCCSLFATMSTILKEDMGPYLQIIVPWMHGLMQNSFDDLTPIEYKEEQPCETSKDLKESGNKEDADANSDIDASESDLDASYESDLDASYESDLDASYESDLDASYDADNNIENAEALRALKILIKSVGSNFLVYIKASFDIAFNALITNNSRYIIDLALDTLVELCICWHKVHTSDALSDLHKALSTLIPKIVELATNKFCDYSLVIPCMEALLRLLQNLNKLVVQDPENKKAIVDCIASIHKNEMLCQKKDREGTDALKRELKKCAADILAALGEAMNHDEFAKVSKTLNLLCESQQL